MSKHFDWQTEVEHDWDQTAEDPPPLAPSPWPRRVLSILIIAGLVAAVGFVLYRLVDRRIDENTSNMRGDIVSSHNLLQIAEADQDDELFFSLLSGRDSSWTAVQHDLFTSGDFYDRASFGLHVQSIEPLSPTNETGYSITFSPDLLAADVTTSRPYEIAIGNGLTQTVTLQDTVQYRLGRERWLLSPPDQAFWGPQASLEGTRLTLRYPQRDEALVERLVGDLDQKVADLCNTVSGVTCPADLHIEIEFSSDPQALLDAASPLAAAQVAGGLKTTMPAPTIVGVPVDEAGYQALYRGYAAQLAAAILAQQVNYECCLGLPFFQALVDFQLSQLALKPWPVTDEMYERVLTDQVRLIDFALSWRSDDPKILQGPEGWRYYALTDYLLKTVPGADATSLQRELVRRGSFIGWLNGLFAAEDDRANSSLLSALTRGFWMQGYTQALDLASSTSADPWTQDLYLTCVVAEGGTEDNQTATLYRFQTNGETWQPLHETARFLWNNPLPGDDLLLQQEFGFDDRRWTTTIREQDTVRQLLPESDTYTISFGQSDPAVSGLAVFLFLSENDDATITWFDLQACDETGCANRELPGIPIWSPDGERAIFTADPNYQIDLLQTELRTVLFDSFADNSVSPLGMASRAALLQGEPLRSATELTPVARGHAPFWLNNDTIGYVTGAGGGDPMSRQANRVEILTLDEEESQTVFTLDDLLPAIDVDSDAARLYWIHYVMVNPQRPDQLYAVVLSVVNQQAYLLSFDRTSGEIEHLLTSGWMANHSLGISPDGRYLVMTGMIEGDPNAGEESALIQVYDLAQQETIPFLSLTADFPPFSTYDWSLDGTRLAMVLDDNIVGLFSPAKRQLQLLETPPGDCSSPLWLNPHES